MNNTRTIEWLDLNYGSPVTKPGYYPVENVGLVAVEQTHIDQVAAHGEPYQVVIEPTSSTHTKDATWRIARFE